MKWFKHFSNVADSDALNDIIDKFGFEGYGRYWRFMEILSAQFDGESVDFKFHKRVLRDCLRFKSNLKLDCFLVAIGLQTGYKVVLSEKQVEINAPILLDLQDRDFKKSRKVREGVAPKIKTKIKIKKEINNKLAEDVFADRNKEIIDYLNDATGKRFKYSSEETKEKIRARFNDGFSVDDFKKVIDNKVSDWRGSADNEKWLRPITLFGRKFEGYLNQERVQTLEEIVNDPSSKRTIIDFGAMINEN